MNLHTSAVIVRLAAALAPAALMPALGSELAAQSAHAPAGDSGTFVIRHGPDTVATEQFARTDTSLHGTLTLRNAKGVAQAYRAALAPDASVPLIEVTVRENLDSGRVKGKIVQQARVIFKEDSAAVDDVSGGGLQTRIFRTERGAVPYLNLSFALLEQAVRRARAAASDSSVAGQVPFFNLGGGQTVDGKLSRLGADSLAMAIGSVEFHLRVDPAGRVLGGRIPSQEVVAERVVR
jgi:hypothetical protein